MAPAELIAETGVDMTRFPSAAHLVSWAKFNPPDPPVCRQVHEQRPRQGKPLAGRRSRPHRLRELSCRHLPRRPLSAPRAPPWQAESDRGHRQLGTDRSLPPAFGPGHRILRPGSRILRIPDQQAPPRPRPRPLTSGTHRPAPRHPRRQSGHHRHCGLIAKPVVKEQHNPATPGASGLPTHHPIFGSE
ncbi:hypothetical protein [Rhodococcus rhodochrous]|uniref:hypothetical protein n=1 Tax=Rhodococcus rhodochrous TaxID=1829 RepID=UPI0036F1A9AC